MKTIRLADDTIGLTDEYDFYLGDDITAYLQDENGRKIEVFGQVVEIMEEE